MLQVVARYTYDECDGVLLDVLIEIGFINYLIWCFYFHVLMYDLAPTETGDNTMLYARSWARKYPDWYGIP